MDKMIRKILIANRGEIAVRVIRTAKKMGIKTVAVYSREDSDSMHVRLADEVFCIGEVELSETYLNIPKIIETALKAKADAIHPGYGFLSENPLFVDACNKAGIIFIGPGSDVMHTMGNKIQAREFITGIGEQVVTGFSGKNQELIEAAERLKFPVLVKAAAGGGGKGMQVVYSKNELQGAIDSASRQAKAYFGDETIYIEKYIEEPRHIEVQILGDEHGNVIHLYERECSIQRRYQKIIEESPSPTLTPEIREKMGAAAVRIGKSAKYTGAGTIEFLVDKNLDFWFLEMNTRIQVEHPVTEMVTGIDIVEEQIHIAEGKPLRYSQDQIHQKGHAIECRIYAEEPQNNFRPSPGRMTFYNAPSGEGIRVDSTTDQATSISPAYDPMIAKLVAYAPDRSDAIGKMISALKDFVVHGIGTNIEFLSEIMHEDAFIGNRISTKYCDEHLGELVSGINRRRSLIPDHLKISAFIIKEMMSDTSATDVWRLTGFWRNIIRIRIVIDNRPYLVSVRKKKDHMEIITEDQNYILKLNSVNNNLFTFLSSEISYTAWISENSNTGRTFISTGGHVFIAEKELFLPEEKNSGSEFDEKHSGEIYSPMPGKVIRINVAEGDKIEKGHLLMIIEAMKMENMITAPVNAVVKKIHVAMNDRIESNARLVELEKN